MEQDNSALQNLMNSYHSVSESCRILEAKIKKMKELQQKYDIMESDLSIALNELKNAKGFLTQANDDFTNAYEGSKKLDDIWKDFNTRVNKFKKYYSHLDEIWSEASLKNNNLINDIARKEKELNNLRIQLANISSSIQALSNHS